MKKRNIFWLLLLISFLSFFSCKKIKVSDCEGNCKNVNVKGYVYDKTTNQPIENMTLRVIWNKPSTGWFDGPTPFTYVIKTNGQGLFSVNIKADTTLTNYKLGITAFADSPIKGKYFPGGLTGNFQNNIIGVYPKTNLKINLHRASSDTFIFSSFKTFTDDESSFGYPNFGHMFMGHEHVPNDTTIEGVAIANIFTKIKKFKRLPLSNITTSIDSIICLPNITTVYNINF
jgi:hypothetical protein